MSASLLSDNLKKARFQKNVDQANLSKMSGVDQPVISRIESGINQNPKLITLTSLAGALGVTVGMLIGEEAIPNARHSPESLA